MNLSVKWENKLLHKELQQTAYSLAKDLHESFSKGAYGTSSYFHSLAERLPEFFKDGLTGLSAKWNEESTRRSVSSYWNVKDIDGQTLLVKISHLFATIIPSRIRRLVRDYGLEVTESSQAYKELFHTLALNMFHFLADFISGEKKNDTDGK